MINRLIRWSIENRILVLIMAVFVTVWGLYSVRETPVDALPDQHVVLGGLHMDIRGTRYNRVE